MRFSFIPKETTDHYVGRIASGDRAYLYKDLLLVTDVIDKDQNPLLDVIVPMRSVYALPDNHVAFKESSVVANVLADGSPDLATLTWAVYVRRIDSYDDTNGGYFRAHGFISEVVAVPPRSFGAGTPSVGELIVHNNEHTYWIDDTYGFVRVYKDLTDDRDYGFFARAVIV